MQHQFNYDKYLLNNEVAEVTNPYIKDTQGIEYMMIAADNYGYYCILKPKGDDETCQRCH